MLHNILEAYTYVLSSQRLKHKEKKHIRKEEIPIGLLNRIAQAHVIPLAQVSLFGFSCISNSLYVWS